MAKGDMIALSASTDDIDTTLQLVAFEVFQKLCIANGENLKIADFQNSLLIKSGAFVTPPLFGDLLTQAGTAATMIVDFVNIAKTHVYGRRTSEALFDTSGSVSSDNAGGQAMSPTTYVPSTSTDRTAGPLWYDWTKHPSKTDDMPPKAYIGCRYRGRAVLSGNPENPWQWYMSRQGDIHDWDYAQNDAQSAIAGQNSAAGLIGDSPIALIPFHDDYLIFAGTHSFHYMRGDPANQGTISALYEGSGIFGAFAHCFDKKGNLWCFGTAGLMMFANTGSGVTRPEIMSDRSWPDFYAETGADPETHRVTLGYDPRRDGIVIKVTLLQDGSNKDYWYDLTTNGLFPETYPKECGGYAMYNYKPADNEFADLIIGCKDGFVRTFEDTAKNDNIGDEEQAIESYVLMPVQALGADSDHNGKANSFTFILSGGAEGGAFNDSDAVSYEFHVADNAEELVEKVMDGDVAPFTGTLIGPGRRQRIRDKVSGGYLAVKLFNSTKDETWSIEFIGYESKSTGRIR
jgi:hypothetical protein